MSRFASRAVERLLVDECDLTWADARTVWRVILVAMRSSLLDGDSVSLSNLGTLTPYKSSGRRYKHPETGELTDASPKVQVRLKLSRNFKDALQQ